jgi:beta-glucosidase
MDFDGDLESETVAFGVDLGAARDSYHRYAEDMRLLADAGLNAYRFSIEWARIEPRCRARLPG